MIIDNIRNFVRKSLIGGYSWFTTVLDDDDLDILEKGRTYYITKVTKGMREWALFKVDRWKFYTDLDEEIAKKVNEVLVHSFVNGWFVRKGKVIEELVNIGLDRDKAETIAMTELSNLANSVRVMYYQERLGINKFEFVNKKDDKVCEKCRRVAELTKGGVEIEMLREYIASIGGGKSREYTVHPRCRCVVRGVRKR